MEKQLTMTLEKFCDYDGSTGEPFLTRPFSIGQHTYATNGHIIVRVPLIETFGPPVNPPERLEEGLGKVLKEPDRARYFKFPVEQIPPKSDDVECPICGGTGHEHECPDCLCECWKCNGSGKVNWDDERTATVNRVMFALRYLRMIAALPDPIILKPRPDQPVLFQIRRKRPRCPHAHAVRRKRPRPNSH
jgi:hypothetical protein